MEPVIIGVVVGIFAVGGFMIWVSRRYYKGPLPKSASSENLADMVQQEDPTQESV
jgi:hypothetical protein